MALQKECPACRYRNPSRARKCRRCQRDLTGRVVWWVRINTGHGKPYTKRIGPDYEAAKRHEIEMRAVLARQKIEPKAEEPAKTITLRDLWPRYFLWCQNNNRNIRGKIIRWRNVIEPRFGDMPLDKITPLMVETFRQERLAEGRKPSTVNNEVSLLRHMLTMAARWGLIPQNPLAGLGNLPPNNEDSWTRLDPEEVDRIILNLPETYRNLCLFLAYSGRRLSEALNLRWEDVDLARNRYKIKRAKRSKEKWFPLTAKAREAILRQAQKAKDAKAGDRVFPHDASNFRRAFKQALKKAGLPKTVRIHDLRHSFGSWCAEAGLSPSEIAELLDHKTLSMVARYTHMAHQVVQKAAARLDQYLSGPAVLFDKKEEDTRPETAQMH